MKSNRLILSLVAAVLTLTAVGPANAASAAGGSSAPEVQWTFDAAHTDVRFKVKHLGITNVTGHFRDYDIAVTLDPEDVSSMAARATIDVGSIDTGVDRRDDHLRSEDFFFAEQHPEITFVSKGVEKGNGDEFTLLGDLTMRGVTLPVELDAELLGVATGSDGKRRAGFEARGTVDRTDFGLKWDNLTEAGGLVVSHDVDIILDVQLVEQ